MIRPTLVLVVASLCLAAPALADPWDLPAPDSCQPAGGVALAPGSATTEDAPPGVPFETGDVFTQETMEKLTRFLPDFLWTHRERFFFEGMRLEIGPCFHDYGPPAFYDAATEAGRGKATLSADGGLEDFGAGQPFAAADLAADDPQAGDKWLWNVQARYQAAGFRGDFRMTDLVGRVGRAEPFIGNLFKILLNHRADRPAPEYRAAGGKSKLFVAGGAFLEPFDARSYAWRQFRDVAVATEEGRSDDLHAYLPNWRRVRRLSANQVEGIYMPSFSVGVTADSSIGVGGAGGTGSLGSISAGAGAGGTIQTKRSGWEGLEWRPLFYHTKVVGIHDVLAPINTKKLGYPAEENRDFGPWGLSFADDTWDLRRALVLETIAKQDVGTEVNNRQILYVDLETLQPLYLATFDKKDEMTNVGMYVSRWSEDRTDYPRWPDDPELPVRVLDSVGASFANLAESGSWRRESWENVGTPPSDNEVKRLISVSQLTKGR
jgi:hypothetical protein